MTATAPRTIPTLYTIDRDGTMRITPHAGQWQTLHSQKRFIFMLAGTQGGKTSWGPHWLWHEIQRCGAGDYLAVTSTYPLLKLKMLPEFLRIFRDELQLGTWHATDKVFTFSKTGEERAFGAPQDVETRVIFGSATKSESLESATAKAAWLDEVGQDAFRIDSWEAVLRRLSLHQGRVLGGTTIYNLGWLKQRIYDRWERGEDPDVEVIQFGSATNPAFPDEEMERAKRDLPAWKYNMFYRGMFTRPPGMIYGDFNDAYREDGGHKVRPFNLPPEWPRYGGIDFGGVNTAKLWLAKDPAANVAYVYHEAHEGNMTTREHATGMLALAKGVNMAGWSGGAKSEGQQRRDFGVEGVPIREPRISDVESGIDHVISGFKQMRLYVFDTCTGLLDELGTYSRVLDAEGEPTEKIKDKETYHHLDALRYVVPVVLPVTGGWDVRIVG